MEMNYLGIGLAHPTNILNGRAVTVSNAELIRQSIGIILKTPKGSRFMLPEFGSRLGELLFDPNDEVVKDLISVFIYDALSDWEKRIKYLSTEFEQQDNIIYCTVKYRILNSNEIDSYIYPFYRELKY